MRPFFILIKSLIALALLLAYAPVVAEYSYHAPTVSAELRVVPLDGDVFQTVAFWLRSHRGDLAIAERRYGVDRRAIAAAIAYEASDNVHSWFELPFTRSVGPGKVHYKDGLFFEGDPVSKQVEDLGYISKATEALRIQRLKTARWSILYIAAIERAEADAMARDGYSDLRCNIPVLMTLYSSWDVKKIRQHFSGVPKHTLVLNEAGEWAFANLAPLSHTVGHPPTGICRSHLAPPVRRYGSND